MIISSNIAEKNHHNGIYVATGGSATDVSKNIIVSANIVKNTQAGGGIQVGSASQDIILSNNRAYDDQGTKTQTYGIITDATTKNIFIKGNKVAGNLTGGMSIAGTGHNVEIEVTEFGAKG